MRPQAYYPAGNKWIRENIVPPFSIIAYPGTGNFTGMRFVNDSRSNVL
jgi:hypothetical protein